MQQQLHPDPSGMGTTPRAAHRFRPDRRATLALHGLVSLAPRRTSLFWPMSKVQAAHTCGSRAAMPPSQAIFAMLAPVLHPSLYEEPTLACFRQPNAIYALCFRRSFYRFAGSLARAVLQGGAPPSQKRRATAAGFEDGTTGFTASRRM